MKRRQNLKQNKSQRMKPTPIEVTQFSARMNADLLTPISAFMKLCDDKGKESQTAFLFESVEGGENLCRYSFLGINPYETLFIQNGILSIKDRRGRIKTVSGNPFKEIGNYLSRYKVKKNPKSKTSKDPALPPFTGGAIGYVAYDSVQYLENIPLVPIDLSKGTQTYDAYLMIFKTVVAFDHVKREMTIISNAFDGAKSEALREMKVIQKKLESTEVQPLQIASKTSPIELTSTLGEARFKNAVQKIKTHIHQGDIFQCVLSERFTAKFQSDSFSLYRALRTASPAPYLFYLKMEDETLMGASPEMMVRVKDGKVETCPIAGTRARGETEARDRQFETQLLKSTKERAEHLMLVDLGRNDLGRISKPGSVQVAEYMQVHRFSHVMHLVSRVEGKLSPGKTAWDALGACFPAGTLSGAPKIRAMQLISELETERRGPYGGAVIYHDFSGNLDSCIVIRSIFCKDGKAHFQAGAGVVADSTAAGEYEEVRRKTRSVLEAFKKVQSQ